MQANLSSLYVDFRDYSSSANPPVLHRKETFVESGYPNYKKFVKLTTLEEKLGLLTNPISIGTKEGWKQRLKECGIVIKGHQAKLIKVE